MSEEMDASDEEDSLYCNVCDMKMSSVRSYMAHCSTLFHTQKQAILENPVKPDLPNKPKVKSPADKQSSVAQTVQEPAAVPVTKGAATEQIQHFYCNYCDVHFNETRAYLAHCSSILHSQRRAQMENPETETTTEEQELEESSSGAMYECLKQFVPSKNAKKKKKKNKNKFYSVEVLLNCGFCALCGVNTPGPESYQNHCSGKAHCKKFLTKQNEVGFMEFAQQFGHLLYGKNDDVEPPPDIEDDYVVHVYRSGVYNKLHCRACSRKMYSFRAWYDHILSREHGQQMIGLLETHGGEAFMHMFGDLPGPNPHLFNEVVVQHKRPKREQYRYDQSWMHGHVDMGGNYGNTRNPAMQPDYYGNVQGQGFDNSNQPDYYGNVQGQGFGNSNQPDYYGNVQGQGFDNSNQQMSSYRGRGAQPQRSNSGNMALNFGTEDALNPAMQPDYYGNVQGQGFDNSNQQMSSYRGRDAQPQRRSNSGNVALNFGTEDAFAFAEWNESGNSASNSSAMPSNPPSAHGNYGMRPSYCPSSTMHPSAYNGIYGTSAGPNMGWPMGSGQSTTAPMAASSYNSDYGNMPNYDQTSQGSWNQSTGTSAPAYWTSMGF